MTTPCMLLRGNQLLSFGRLNQDSYDGELLLGLGSPLELPLGGLVRRQPEANQFPVLNVLRGLVVALSAHPVVVGVLTWLQEGALPTRPRRSATA